MPQRPRIGGNRGHGKAAARGRADHRSGAQRRPVSGNGVPADGGARALARGCARGGAPAASARRPAADQARNRSSRGRMTCTGSAPPRTSCATSRRRMERTTPSARASSAFACCSSWTAIRSWSPACSSFAEPAQTDPDIEGRAHGLKARAAEILAAPAAGSRRGGDVAAGRRGTRTARGLHRRPDGHRRRGEAGRSSKPST